MTGLYVWIAICFTVCFALGLADGREYYYTNRNARGICNIDIRTVVGFTLWWFVIAGGISTFVLYGRIYGSDHWATCHVTNKDKGQDGRSYRVYTSDCGTLKNKDSIFRNKHNSDTVWQEIPKEGTVRFRIAGWSRNPNIFGVQPAQ